MTSKFFYFFVIHFQKVQLSNSNNNARDVVYNNAHHLAQNKGNDQYCRDNDKDAQLQECKIFDINGLDDKYLHSILNVASDKKSWKIVNNEVSRAWRRFKGLNIVHLEMLNILVAVKLFCAHWKGMSILNYCDNFAVVNVLRSGRARDPYLAACARNIWLWAATHDIHFIYTHVSGKSNRTADLLSWWANSPSNVAELNMLVPSPIWVLVGLEALEIDAKI